MFESIDWAATGTMIAGLGSWAGAMALLYAAHIGKQTVDGWRRQQVIAREVGLAEDMLHQSVSVADRLADLLALARRWLLEGSGRTFAGVANELEKEEKPIKRLLELSIRSLAFSSFDASGSLKEMHGISNAFHNDLMELKNRELTPEDIKHYSVLFGVGEGSYNERLQIALRVIYQGASRFMQGGSSSVDDALRAQGIAP